MGQAHRSALQSYAQGTNIIISAPNGILASSMVIPKNPLNPYKARCLLLLNILRNHIDPLVKKFPGNRADEVTGFSNNIRFKFTAN